MKNFLTLLCLGIFIIGLSAQPLCLPEPNGVAAGDEFPGCVMCASVYQGSTEGYTPESPPIDFPCGIVENSQWISIFPDHSGVIDLTFLPSNCTNAQGIQAVIFDENLSPVSDCFSSAGGNQVGNILAADLDPLQIYYVLIDGFSGDECDFLMINSSERGLPIMDTVICPGSCLVFEDSCYFESVTIPLLASCEIDVRFNIIEADTGDFEITPFIDSFTNSIAFNWSGLGADSFDIFIDNVFEKSQDFSSYLLPITPDLKDSFTLRVVPRSHLGCAFKASEINYLFEEVSSKIDEQNALKNAITISPNPSKNIFRINSKTKIFETTVFDINGKKMMIEKSEVLNLSTFENGIYFLKIQTDLGMILKRVLKI